MAQRKSSNCGLHLVNTDRDCNTCDLPKKCIGDGLDKTQSESISSLIKSRGPFQAGETIFRMEESFKSIFAIESGSVKVASSLDDGTPLIHGFYFDGELIGIEAIGDTHYQNDAVALETTWICELPFDKIESLCIEIPKLQHEILELLGKRIRYTNSTIVRGRYLSADKRFLLFLNDLYQRKGTIKANGDRVVTLPMTKGDIAIHLGLRPESLSRALSKLQEEGIIQNRSREIQIIDENQEVFSCLWV